MTPNFKAWRTKLNGAEFKLMRLNDSHPQPEGTSRTTDNPQAVVDYLTAQLTDSLRYSPDTENLIVILLSTRRLPIGWQIVSNGTIDTLLVHAREVFRPAIILNAAAIILAHNHPSGDPSPSEADIKVTRDMIRAGQLIGIELLDHIILGRSTPERPQSWVSLRELGYFSF